MIGIVTDSTCDIPGDLLEKYSIIVIPTFVIWGEQQLRDRIDIHPVAFYHRLVTDPARPHTSQPSPAAIQDAFQRAIERGATQIIALTVSSAMSGTYAVVESVARQMAVPVSVVDAKGSSMSLGWQVLAAACARDAGTDVDEIIDRVSKVRSNLVQLVAMNSLEYLQRGGRIGEAAKWVGTLLSIKPLVSINHQTGRVEPVSLARTQKALVERLYREFFERLKGRKNLHIAVLHGNAPEQAEELAERVRAEYSPVELLVNITGPVLGINTGPGALALCGYAEDW
jgi:DegV family protein with EDD domain